eukprot:353034-Chlamydomonas_euryale.AAC.3
MIAACLHACCTDAVPAFALTHDRSPPAPAAPGLRACAPSSSALLRPLPRRWAASRGREAFRPQGGQSHARRRPVAGAAGQRGSRRQASEDPHPAFECVYQ